MNEIKLRSRRQRGAHKSRQRALKSYYRRKQNGTLPPPKPITEAQRNCYNENRRAKTARHPSPIPETTPRIGFNIVSASNLNRDLTRWSGPGERKVWKLEKQADKILRRAERKAKP